MRVFPSPTKFPDDSLFLPLVASIFELAAASRRWRVSAFWRVFTVCLYRAFICKQLVGAAVGFVAVSVTVSGIPECDHCFRFLRAIDFRIPRIAPALPARNALEMPVLGESG
jgi:hypothetical protein